MCAIGGLTVFPEVLDEGAGGVVEQSRHVVIQRIHVLSQPVGCVVIHLEGERKQKTSLRVLLKSGSELLFLNNLV